MKEAIVLAGGVGSRLGRLTADTPKPLVRVAGRPFLEFILDYLAEQGIGRVMLSVGYLAAKVESHFGKRYSGLELQYAVEQAALGTGGAIRYALGWTHSPDVFVLNGDTLFKVALQDLLAMHKEQRATATIALKHMADCARYGRVERRGAEVVAFREKGIHAPGEINGGVYVINGQRLLRLMPEGPFSLERDLLMARLREVRPIGMPADAYFRDIGVPEDYRLACEELAG
jgi:D-glycero-alpha-D-manno-heptose 1-phosphate guanylyltransferase